MPKPSPPPRALPTLELEPEGHADERALDVRPARPARPALWETLLGGIGRAGRDLAVREPAPLAHAGGWLKRLVLRLVLIAVLLGVGLVVVVYLVARALP